MSEILEQYKDFVSNFVAVHKKAVNIELGSFEETKYGAGKKVMLFSPHPDDECVVGALPLRLKNELDAQVINVAVTLGSNKDRKEGRLDELMKACKTLGFELLLPCDLALDGINPANKDAEGWDEKVDLIAKIIIDERPDIVLFPHDNDYNSTHIGVNLLVMDALEAASNEVPEIKTVVLESEFWQMMDKPNLMIGLSHDDEAQLIYALSAHTGEVERNPYHINHPARMLDNVTRGSEVVGGQGGSAVNFDFAMIYRCSVFANGEIQPAWEGGKTFGDDESLEALFEL